MKKFLIGGAAAALVVAVVPAWAQPAPPTPPGVAAGTAPATVPPAPPAAPRMHMMRMMHMSDKVMTRDEVVRHVRDLFARLDTNHDGFVTKEEVEAVHQKMAGMSGMHGDLGKRFAEGHFPMPDRAAMFDKIDTNHDGSISRQEFMAAHSQEERRVFVIREGGAPGAPGAPEAPGEPAMKMHMHGMGAGGMGFGGHLFEMADANHDGRVSLAEAQAAALAHFDRADLNHDGKITPEERQQAHELRRQHRSS